MVPSITRQSIIIKCQMQSSIMIGNYEYYYAAGLFLQLTNNVPPSEDIKPRELETFLRPLLESYVETEVKADYLVRLLKGYEPSDMYDEQMKELLLWGLGEERQWEIFLT